MKDFAKSIYVGNASGTKEFNTEADLRRWCIEHQYAYTPTHGGYYRLEDDKPGRNRPDLEAHVKAGNSKVGNASTFDRLDDAVHYASNLTDEALRRLNGTFSATNLISALSKCKQACDDAIKLAQQYDHEMNK